MTSHEFLCIPVKSQNIVSNPVQNSTPLPKTSINNKIYSPWFFENFFRSSGSLHLVNISSGFHITLFFFSALRDFLPPSSSLHQSSLQYSKLPILQFIDSKQNLPIANAQIPKNQIKREHPQQNSRMLLDF
jgi:hypothetical protein